MRNYSFSNIANQQSYAPRKSNDFSQLYRHSDLKTVDPSLRFDQIKKKYDTPSRVDALRQSKDFDLQRQEMRDINRDSRPTCNSLKESFAVNRLQKNSLKFQAEVKDIVREREFRRSNQKENEYRPSKCDFRDQEGVIISKVREMKESIINQEYPKPLPARSSVPSFTKNSNYVQAKYEGRREFDPRVENIDKINSKIKQILSCLSDNEKHQHNFRETRDPVQKDESTSKDSAYFGFKTREGSQSKRQFDSVFTKQPDLTSKLSSIDQKPPPGPQNLSQIQDKYEPYISKPPIDSHKFKNRQYSVSRAEIYSKESRPIKYEEQIAKTPVYLSKDQGLRGASRSRSQIDSIKKSAITPNENVLRSGKKVNDEISRIQKIIQEFEQQKRKLNIEFTPFTLKNKSTANLNLSYSAKPEHPSEDVKQPSNETAESRAQEPSRFTASQRSSSNDLKFKSYLNKAADYSQKYGNFANKDREASKSTIYDKLKPKSIAQEGFQLKIQQIEVRNIQLEDASIENNEDNINCQEQHPSSLDGEALKRRTDEGIEERRRRRQNSPKDIIATETLKSIVSLFCQQVKLDENLRNLKIWLEACQDNDKNSKLSKALEAAGVQLSPEECRNLFTLDQSENNPFFSVQSFAGSYPVLAETYCASQDHWKCSIQHKFDREALLSQGFSAQKIDLERKGFIELEDLVRFLNIESGTFFRNRDLFLIFRRLTSTDRVEFDSVLDEVSV